MQEEKWEGGAYFFHHYGVGLVRVPRRKLRVEVRPEIGKHTGRVLLDFVGSKSGATEAVIVAEEASKLRYLFAQHGVKFPGISPVRATAHVDLSGCLNNSGE